MVNKGSGKTMQRAAEGGQCPGCFTFNFFKYAGADAQPGSGADFTLKCALCGLQYGPSASPVAA